MIKNFLVRAIYLYLFSIVGLALISIGAVKLANLGLKIFIFTKVDQQINYNLRPPVSLIGVKSSGEQVTEDDFISAIKKCQAQCQLTEEQQNDLKDWLADYKEWQEGEGKLEIDYQAQQRQREASSAIAFIVVGLLLYLYHWSIIKKEIKQV